MRHKKAGVKLHRTTSHRQAMFRNMVTSLFKHDRIRTTDVKAKELRRWADQIITLAKRGDLHARRQVLAIVREKDVVHKLFAEAQERFGEINGGYTRIVKIGHRPGDAAPVSLIELVAKDEKAPKSKKKTKPADKKKQAPPIAASKETVVEAPQAAPEAEAAADTTTTPDSDAVEVADTAVAEAEEATDSPAVEAEAAPEAAAAPPTTEETTDAAEEPEPGASEDAPKKE